MSSTAFSSAKKKKKRILYIPDVKFKAALVTYTDINTNVDNGEIQGFQKRKQLLQRYYV